MSESGQQAQHEHDPARNGRHHRTGDNGGSPSGIPARRRHDAPPQNRPYVVYTPVYYLLIWASLLCLPLVWIATNPFAFLSALAAWVLAVACAPEVLNAGSLATVDRWAKRRAKRRRERRVRRHRHIELALLRLEWVTVALFGLGCALLVATPAVALLGGAWFDALGSAVGLALMSLGFEFTRQLAAGVFAQLKGDVPAGPMYYLKVAWLEDAWRGHDRLRSEVRLWSAVLTAVFLVAMVVVDALQ